MLSRRLHVNPDKVCYRKRYALSNTCLFVSRQTYVKDMSARPLVVGAAAAVFCYASSHKTQAVRGLYNSHWDLEANSRPIAEDLSRRTAHCQHATPPQKGGIFRF